ncbi:MAG: CHC2 zinc finger domain-containing protein, partial [Betaproteobacteria bacterium]
EAGEPLSIHSAPNAPAQQASSAARRSIDYQSLRTQVTFDQVLGAIGQPVSNSSQHRGPCPLHDRESAHGHSFSVNLKRNIFRCFDSGCRAQGNVLEFWMAYRQLPLYEAAEDLAQTLRLELPTNEQRAPTTHKTKGKKHAGITPPSP